MGYSKDDYRPKKKRPIRSKIRTICFSCNYSLNILYFFHYIFLSLNSWCYQVPMYLYFFINATVTLLPQQYVWGTIIKKKRYLLLRSLKTIGSLVYLSKNIKIIYY